MKDVLKSPQPSEYEFVFCMFVVISSILFFTFIDIMIHDSYVRPIIAECHESNKSDFCEDRRKELLLQPFFWMDSGQNDQLKLGSNYWFTLLMIPIFVAVLLAVLRPFMGILAGAKINPMLVIIGLLWGFSVLSLYYFAWLDFFYFFLRGLEVPPQLPWLNGIGLFQFVQPYSSTLNVDKEDMYLLMTIGIVLLIGIWSLLVHHHKKGTFKKLGLI